MMFWRAVPRTYFAVTYCSSLELDATCSLISGKIVFGIVRPTFVSALFSLMQVRTCEMNSLTFSSAKKRSRSCMFMPKNSRVSICLSCVLSSSCGAGSSSIAAAAAADARSSSASWADNSSIVFSRDFFSSSCAFCCSSNSSTAASTDCRSSSDVSSVISSTAAVSSASRVVKELSFSLSAVSLAVASSIFLFRIRAFRAM